MFGWWCLDTQDTFFPLAREQGHYDNNYILLLFILMEYLPSGIMIRTGPLSVDTGICNAFFFFLSNWKHSPKLQWFPIVTLIFITTAAVWKHGFRSLACKCLFPHNPRWSGTHIRYLTCETHVTLADDLAALEHYSCLVTWRQCTISDLLGFGLNHFLLTDENSDPSGRRKKKVRQWTCVILCVNVVITFNTFLYKKWKEDWLLGVSGGGKNHIHMALAIVLSLSKSRAVWNLLKISKLLCLL